MIGWNEEPMVFHCEREQLVGMLHRGANPDARLGVLIVVGGPQYRVGSHRQFVLMARDLAAAGYPVRLVAEVGRVTDSPARRNAAAAAQAQLAAEKIVFDDPLVQSLMRDFGAKIVPGSIKPA